jgi:aryl-alcohol dehydrogenase-like predicted oxidoreductase
MRRLGKSDLLVAPLALGCNVFGWTADEKTAFAILDAFVDQGLNLIDTANIYSTWVPGNKGGESETIIGKWLKKSGKRNKIVLATKVGMELAGTKGLKSGYIRACLEDSLKRLQTDRIDLYQAHKDDPETPLEETLETFDQLIQEGKVRAIGASNYEADRLEKALSISKMKHYHSYISLQPYYNLYDRERFESTLEPLCLKNNLGVISYFSLAQGFLTGKYRSSSDLKKSQRGANIERYLDSRGMNILKALDSISKFHQVSPAAVALAWLIQRPSITAPIVSATSVDQLKELVKSTQLNLSAKEVLVLDQASAYNHSQLK